MKMTGIERFRRIIFVALALFVCTNVGAQVTLEGLFKSAKKAVTEKVKKTANQAVSKANENLKAAVIGTNPFKDMWRIDDIKAYGVKTSTNFGKVWLVIKAEAIYPLEYGYVALGGSLDKTYAVIDGKTYKPYQSVADRFEMPEGVPMVLDTENSQGVYITNVPITATEIAAYNMYIYIDGGRHQTALWKKIPITWKEE